MFNNRISGEAKRIQPRPFSVRKQRSSAIEPLETRILFSTYTVTNLHDSGVGSLRSAVQSANLHAGADTINFKTGLKGTIALTTGQLELSDTKGATTINGPGASLLSISGNHASRILMLDTGVTASISGLTFTNGHETVNGYGGGGILNWGTLTVRNSVIKNNQAVSGGGIASYHALSLVNTTITANALLYDISSGTLASGAGGGILSVNSNTTSTLSMSGCTVSYNQAAYGDVGPGAKPGVGYVAGGIYSSGTGTITGCTFTNNYAYLAGGAICVNANLVTISKSTFSSNTAQYDGGAIDALDSGHAAITASTFNGNSEVHSAAAFGLTYGTGGGALFVDLGSRADVTNSTFTANTAPYGGAIASIGDVVLNNDTLVGNNSSVGHAGAVETAFGQSPGEITANNTIFAGNTHTVTTASGIQSTFADIDSNLSGFNNLIGVFGIGQVQSGFSGNILGVTDPRVRALGFYGGPTETMPLLSDSPAINHGRNNSLPASISTDQEGLARIVGGIVDIGAMEFGH